jgi:hypothetical protein
MGGAEVNYSNALWCTPDPQPGISVHRRSMASSETCQQSKMASLARCRTVVGVSSFLRPRR